MKKETSRKNISDEARRASPTSPDKNYDVECFVCGAKPTVRDTELCGPCCFGEAATADGNW